MCNNRAIAQTEGGYVFQCLRCGLIQVAYGTSLVSLNMEGFHEMRREVRQRRACPPQDGLVNHKRIVLELGCSFSRMILNHLEVEELGELLDHAGFEMELQHLIHRAGS